MFLYRFKVSLFALSLLMALCSCHKSDRDNDTDVTVAADALSAHNAINNLFILIDNVAKSDSGFYRTNAYLPACAVITKNTSVTPKTLKIAFDKNTGCVYQGKLFKGELNAQFYGNYNQTGSRVIISPTSLYMDTALLTTKITVTNKGLNSAGHTIYGVSIVDAQVLKNGATTFYNAALNYERTEGGSTAVPNDDAYNITGTFNGISLKGPQFTGSITKDVLLRNGCYFPQSGKMNIDIDKFATRIVDFGSGCDNTANVSIAKNDYSITLK
jgi:hypothetical protein